MIVQVQTDGFELSEALENHIHERLDQVLGDHRDRISLTRIRLTDIRGNRGGEGKRCRIKLVMPRMRKVFVDHVEADMYHAIDSAVNRVGRVVTRRLSRKRTRYLRLKGRDSRRQGTGDLIPAGA